MQHISFRHFATCKKLLSKQVKPFDEIPGPRSLPLVGNVWRYLPFIGTYKIDQLLENAQYNRRHYGPIVREHIINDHTILHLFDPVDVESYFRQDGKEPHRRSHRALLKYRREAPERYNDGGLFPENGPSWSRIRAIVQKYLMRPSEISLRAGQIDEITCNLLDTIDTDKAAPVVILSSFENSLYRWSLRCSLSVFLDYNLHEMPDNNTLDELIKCLHEELSAIEGTEIRGERWLRQPHKCPFYQKLAKSEDVLYEFVRTRISHLIASNQWREISFLRDWLIKDQIDQKDVIGIVLDCILAGLHTTAFTTMFLLYNISMWSPLERVRLSNELSDHVPQKLMLTDISDRLHILKDCLKETLRLNPVSIGTGRLTQHNSMIIRNFSIPKGIMVIAHNQIISKDPQIYKDPNEFKPDRWPEYRAQPRHLRPSPFAWLPYGFGPRACIGQRLVNLQICIIAARLLQRYNIKFIDKEIKTKTTLVHCLAGQVRVELHTRLGVSR